MLLREMVALSVICILSSCQGGDVISAPQAVTTPRVVQSSGPAPDVCDRLAEIKIIPATKELPADDEVYRGFMSMGERAVPCLLDHIADTTPMSDPRQTPKYADFTVGDAAFIMLERITEMPLEEVLPEEIIVRIKHEGFYAYFAYVEKPVNRSILRGKCREWVGQRRAGQSAPQAAAAPRVERPATSAPDVCDRLAEIKIIPFKEGLPIDDEVYRGFMSMGERAVPCLLDHIADTTPMNDPRQTPKYADFTVGDAAFIMLDDIMKVPYEEVLPEDIIVRMDREGFYAYFAYVEKPANRSILQQKCREWVNQRKNSQLGFRKK